MEDTLKNLLDREAVRELLTRYALALDDKDWKKLASCFLPDATAFYGADLGLQDGYAAIENTCRTALAPLDSSHHLIGSIHVEVEGDTAKARCYLHAQHTKAGVPGGDNFTIGGEYRDEIVRTPNGWKIKKRELRMLWQDGNLAVIAG